MQETIKKLEEISRKYDQVSMLAMDQNDFKRYFASIYAETSNYYSQPLLGKCFAIN